MTRSPRTTIPRPLEGLRVIDLTIWLYGPLAGTLLADLGATVVKIERPEHGDFSRSLETLQGASMRTSDRRNLAWELFNRNKQSLTLNLRAPEGQEVLRRLVAGADAFVTNFQPSTLAAFHALPSELLEINPRLVYGLGAGLGTKGRFADVPSQDTAAMAYSGYMFTSSPDPDQPYYPPGGMADVLSGTNLAFGVTSALLGRERHGKGRVVTTSLLQSMMWTQMLNVGVAANNGESLRSAPRGRASNPLMNAYRCGDDRWIALGVPYLHDSAWAALGRALGAPPSLSDARFATEASRWQNVPALIATLDAIFAGAPCATWVERCRSADVWCSPVNRPSELDADEAVIEEGLVGATASGIRHVRGPFTLEGSEADDAAAPALGASTDAVLEDAGFSRAEIARLRAAKAI
jgi:crotonobetainyl-CoA:carnitine CoA-transferase CaiB-like acyl-CoA transferase